MLPTVSAFAAILMFSVAMAYAGLRDFTAMIIPNVLILALTAAYFPLAFMAGLDWTHMVWSAGGGTLVLAGGVVLFAIGWIGGGDAKLAAVTAVWLGADLTMSYLLYTAVLGAALTLSLLCFRCLPPSGVLSQPCWAAKFKLRQTGVPYGVALALAAVLLFPRSAWMLTL